VCDLLLIDREVTGSVPGGVMVRTSHSVVYRNRCVTGKVAMGLAITGSMPK